MVVVNWATRFVLSWQLSNSTGKGFCLDALSDALQAITAAHVQPSVRHISRTAAMNAKGWSRNRWCWASAMATAGVSPGINSCM